MQNATLKGGPGKQGIHRHTGRVTVQSPVSLISRKNPSTVTVSYRDGALLSFLFDGSTTIVELVSIINRAGTVRKVAL
jgi:hypothetical protein